MKLFKLRHRFIWRLCVRTSRGGVHPWGSYRNERCQVVKNFDDGARHKISPGLPLLPHPWPCTHDIGLTATLQNLTIPIGPALRWFSSTRFIRRRQVVGVISLGRAADKRYSLGLFIMFRLAALLFFSAISACAHAQSSAFVSVAEEPIYFAWYLRAEYNPFSKSCPRHTSQATVKELVLCQ